MSNTLRVVGIDPALQNMGVVFAEVDLSQENYPFKVVDMQLFQTEGERITKVVIGADGKKRTKKVKPKNMRQNLDDLRRSRVLAEGFAKACAKADVVIAEVPIGSQDARACVSYGICLGLLSTCPTPFVEVMPNEVKIAGTGIDTATKGEMIEAAIKEHPEASGLWLRHKLKGEMVLLDKNEHLADAIFAIKAGLAKEQFKKHVETLKQLKNAQLN
ncbi:hypothetical protein HN283_13600 [Acinetobacter baumannii]|uniref:hypothetical protein n=1 Tax=Acinetobacter baumannii TaxID=470 RepID=UPI0018984890|nr:hypothetical protein [Acinetobacter baumannii]MBF6813557.1 hypothetical protein [Acinetobacter baumannii]MBF6914109.1 hypothetical protein [Acinetobacter baumannii]MBF6974634.1 hypothetical protein [Acinetobacter baumannii]